MAATPEPGLISLSGMSEGIDLTPDEARQLANALLHLSDRAAAGQ
ncbi:MAG: hypothetical protein ACR2MP_05365 [Streptosporangiaceae bacterium]